jgi:hypothetical protein
MEMEKAMAGSARNTNSLESMFAVTKDYAATFRGVGGLNAGAVGVTRFNGVHAKCGQSNVPKPTQVNPSTSHHMVRRRAQEAERPGLLDALPAVDVEVAILYG